MLRFRLRRWPLAAAALLLAGCAGPGPGSPTPERAVLLLPGQVQAGELQDSTPRYGGRGRFHLYRFDAREGERFAIELRSTEFDPYLVLGDRSTGLFDPLEQDDDGAGGRDARVRFTAEGTGTFWVVAQALRPAGTGTYTIRLQRLPEPREAVPVAVQIGRPVHGELQEDDPLLEADQSHYDLYTFQGRAGQRYAISQVSDDFDPFLHVGPWREGEVDVAAQDDDGGSGSNARLVFTAPADGVIGILANSYGNDGLGRYTLRVDPLPETLPAEPRPIAVGDTVTGELELTDPVLDDGSYYDAYTFRGQAGDEVVIRLESDAFDAYLALGRTVDGEFTLIESNDDGPDAPHALLHYRLDQDGELTIHANSLSGGETGAYRLSVQRL